MPPKFGEHADALGSLLARALARNEANNPAEEVEDDGRLGVMAGASARPLMPTVAVAWEVNGKSVP